MWTFLSENLATIAVLMAVLLLVGGVIAGMVSDKKKNPGCGGCAGCPNADKCQGH